jgi:DNA-binding transcriptional LysR family regulator
MKPDLLDPDLLLTFLTVERLRSFTLAARELFISQPAVSRQVRQLEVQLGVSLFEKIGRSIQPTAAGIALTGDAERVLGDLQRVAERVKAYAGAERGSLRIGASTTPGLYLLPGLLGRFQQRYPNVDLSYSVENSYRVQEKVLGNEIDLGFIGARLSDGGLLLEPIVDDEIVFFAARSHPLAKMTKVSLRHLEKETWVIREEGSATRKLVEAFLARAGSRIGRAITLASPEALKAVVAGGLGISFLSAYGIRDDLKRGRLKKLRVPGFRLTRPIFLIRHERKHVTPILEEFLKLVRDALA